MAALLAARRKDFAASGGLHARTKSVNLGAAALPRLICTLWQNSPLIVRYSPSGYRAVSRSAERTLQRHAGDGNAKCSRSGPLPVLGSFESLSVLAASVQGQESPG